MKKRERELNQATWNFTSNIQRIFMRQCPGAGYRKLPKSLVCVVALFGLSFMSCSEVYMNFDSISAGDPDDAIRKLESMSRQSAVSGEQRYRTVQNCNGSFYAIEISFLPQDQSEYEFLQVIDIASTSLDKAFLELKEQSDGRFPNRVVEQLVSEKLSECWLHSPHRNNLMDFVVVVSDPAEKVSGSAGIKPVWNRE